MDELMVTIPLNRYEELVKTETRVNVVVERFMQQKYLTNSELLYTLGTELAVELASKIMEEAQKYTQETEE